ncbi:zinc-dependent alcohol dehydrogenase family protein [Enterobacteriaceae bacterium H20N1]|uniref:Zinc-dependent alcohol dehydrogenase family protein n=1 Tax=Dryocola boscaweniae TaxID=2925397 RepID=A0A9X2WCG6_9ENTR|nr:zinc-dependent alcohol dehydrogenase family protein [Dryocola boscaweniae]MCT4703829.1 zinc-dependent alcohol dehydrogenase family protein [Dryocola boscaweniae]MCT4720997.1 zinc-dependent alcohol dehydrogenase family protein [Dryocola boscaweniae]
MDNSALWFREFGQPEKVLTLEHAPLTARAAGKLRVQMRYSPINPSDLIPVTGAYRHRVVPPRVAGYEGVGVVVEADNPALTGLRVLPLRGEGTWQRWLECDPQWAVPVPDSIPDVLAARGYINPLAAYVMLSKWPVRGKTVLLTAATSSCARLLAQWAKSQGARAVLGVYRSESQTLVPEEDGIFPVSINDKSGLRHAAQQAEIVFDAVGGALATTLLQHMRPGTDFISYGLLSGELYQMTGAGVHPQRFHLRDTLAVTAAEVWQQWFIELWDMLAASRLPEVRLFPLENWREALDEFAVPGRRSKPMLVM